MIAITRDVSVSIAACELTHISRTQIDYERARDEHRRYRSALRELGCTVIEIPADAMHPDCVFVEDTAVVLPGLGIMTRPGAESRRGELPAVEVELGRLMRIVRMTAPATLDGGDVLIAGATMYVGLSQRTNAAGVQQLRNLTGMNVVSVPVSRALHLKTAVTRVAADTLLIDRSCVDASPFAGFRLIDIDPSEPFAANALLVGDTVIYPTAFPRTRERLERTGFRVRGVDAGELGKAEGGVTCCSLLV